MQGDLSLVELLGHFEEVRGEIVQSYHYTMRAAIKWFRRVVGSAFVTDLSQANVDRLIAEASAAGMSGSYLDRLVQCLTTLWHFASRVGLADVPARRRRKHLYDRARARPVRRRRALRELPPSMPRLVEVVRVDQGGRSVEPEIVLPTFDGAAVSSEAPKTVNVKREKFSRYRKRW